MKLTFTITIILLGLTWFLFKEILTEIAIRRIEEREKAQRILRELAERQKNV